MILTKDKGQRMWGWGGSGSSSNGGINVNQLEGMLSGYASQDWVSQNYLSIEFFSKLFKAYGPAETEGDPDVEIEPNDTESTISNIEAMFGFWTESYLSALGLGPDSGGGGASLNEPLASINTAGLANHPATAGQTIVWNGSAWAYGTAGAGSVTSVAMSVPTGFVINGTPITSYGTLALSFATGYGLPLTADVDKGVTAYGWGNHAIAGYALASNVYSKADADGRFLTISFFRSLFKAYQSNDTTEVVPNNGDTSLISSIKAMFGFWTEQYVSALGLGPSGGGGVSLNEPLSSINSAGLSAPSVTGSVLMWNGSTWTYNTQSGTDTKNTAGATNNTAISLYLVGAPSQTSNPETYTRTGCYIDANGYLFSGGVKVLTDAVQSIVIGASGTPISPVNGVVTLPEYPTVTDTKNTAGATDLPSVKLYLIGANGQTANPQTYTNSGCYIDANGYLFSGGVKVLTSAVQSVVIGASGTPISPVNGVVTLPPYPSKTSDLTNDSGFITGYTDTKNTAGATDNVNTKLFLIGSTSQGANPQTYSNQSCYIGSDNCLYSGGSKVMTAASGYLPLTGGTMTGNITIMPGVEINTEYDSGHPTLLAFRPSDMTGVQNNEFGIGWHDCTTVIRSTGNIVHYRGSSSERYKIWDEYNDGTGSGLDADLLDGHHASYFSTTDTKNTAGATDIYGANQQLYIIGAPSQTANPETFTHRNCYISSSGYLYSGGDKVITTAGGTITGNIDVLKLKNASGGDISLLLERTNKTSWRIMDSSGDLYFQEIDGGNTYNALVIREKFKDSGTKECVEIYGNTAIHAGNISSYLTGYLPTSGGTITGDLTVNGKINGKLSFGGTSTTAYLRLNAVYADVDYIHLYVLGGTNNTRPLVLQNGYGNVGIGTTTPSYKLDVSGTLHASGDVNLDGKTFIGTGLSGNYKLLVNGSIICTSVTQTSDVRKKDIIADKTIELWQVAQAPIFTFTWSDKELGYDTHVGTSAQYWKSIVPEAVQQSGNGYLGMQYDVVALLAAVTTAKKVQDHEMRIQALERENEALKNELSRLKAA